MSTMDLTCFRGKETRSYRYGINPSIINFKVRRGVTAEIGAALLADPALADSKQTIITMLKRAGIDSGVIQLGEIALDELTRFTLFRKINTATASGKYVYTADRNALPALLCRLGNLEDVLISYDKFETWPWEKIESYFSEARRICRLGPNHIRLMTAEHIRLLRPKQIGFLLPAQIRAFTPEQITWFPATTFHSLVYRGWFLPEQVHSFTSKQFQSLEGHYLFEIYSETLNESPVDQKKFLERINSEASKEQVMDLLKKIIDGRRWRQGQPDQRLPLTPEIMQLVGDVVNISPDEKNLETSE